MYLIHTCAYGLHFALFVFLQGYFLLFQNFYLLILFHRCQRPWELLGQVFGTIKEISGDSLSHFYICYALYHFFQILFHSFKFFSLFCFHFLKPQPFSKPQICYHLFFSGFSLPFCLLILLSPDFIFISFKE